ncbi:hypothetical protein ACL598_19225 [Bordetella bronchialis]|uniref:hypothetical protein n=1 Tax=Bordetella bronchialis TaxID=463025 RepID=UPI003D007D06
MSADANALRDGMRAYLMGYGRNNAARLKAIAAYEAWPLLAERETERRMFRLLEALPIDEVMAIAKLEIDMNELARQALAALGEG